MSLCWSSWSPCKEEQNRNHGFPLTPTPNLHHTDQTCNAIFNGMRESAHMILQHHMPCIHIEDPIVTRVSLTAPYGGRTYEAVIQSLLRQLQFVAYTRCLSKTNVSSKIQELCPQQTYKRKTPNAQPRWLDCLIAKQQISCLLKPSNPFLTGHKPCIHQPISERSLEPTSEPTECDTCLNSWIFGWKAT